MTTGSHEPEQPEEMGAFFDARAGSYDEHMREAIPEFEAFYAAVARALPPTDSPIKILDLGIGTGAEVAPLLTRAPNAAITGVDLSAEMLTLLRAKHASQLSRLTLLHASYQDMGFGQRAFDAVVSVMTLHHHTPSDKLALYRRIRASLRPGGRFISGDYVDSSEETVDHAAVLRSAMGSMAGSQHARSIGDAISGTYHIDIPLSVDEEIALLTQGGFDSIHVVRRTEHTAILVARVATTT